MFKWTIVQEAKRKKKDDKDTEINEDEIAKRDEVEEDNLEETDYTEDEVNLDDEDLEEDETSIEEDDVAQDVDGDEIADDEEGTDYTEDEAIGDDTSASDEIADDEEGTDYTEDEAIGDDTSAGDEIADDETPTNTGNPNDVRNASLIYDYIQLYNTIKSIIAKVNSMNKTDIIRNKTIIQVSKNLNILLNTLHKYIIKSFDKNSYVFNLYQFNLFIHAINVNIEMIKKNNELVSKG